MCYRERYERDWLCVDCDDAKRGDTWREGDAFTAGVYSLRMVGRAGRRMRINHTPYRHVGTRPLCPCGRREAMQRPPGFQVQVRGVGRPWRGSQWVEEEVLLGTWERLRSTRVCTLCCGFVVPADDDAVVGSVPRRSVRVRNRRLGVGKGEYAGFTMLGAKGMVSGGRVNKNGFESRVVKR